MNHTDAVAFAEDWVTAWNSHDLDRVLSHFADDVVFTSPVAAGSWTVATVSSAVRLR